MNKAFLPKLPVCILLFIIAISALAQDSSKGRQVGTASISGRMTIDGNPVAGASVFLMNLNNSIMYQSSDIAATTKTDADGHFEFTGLAAGKYGVTSYQPGMVQTPTSRFGQIDKSVFLADGEPFDIGEINLKRGAVITGRVTDQDGVPIIEVPVRIYSVASGTPTPFSCITCGKNLTDDRGIYRQYGLPPGQYLVSVGQDSISGSVGLHSNLKLTYHPGTTDLVKAETVTVGPGDEISDINIIVRGNKKSFSVSGRVVDSVTGDPLPNIKIAYGTLSPDKRFLFPTAGVDVSTKQTGEFRIDGVAPGEYALQLGVFGIDNVYTDPIPFQVVDSDVTDLEIRAITALTIKGTVQLDGNPDASSSAGLAGLQLFATEVSTPIGHMLGVAPDGSFTISGMRAGTVSISIAPANNPGFSLIRIEGNLPINGNTMELSTQESATGIKLIVGYSPNRIHGQVQIVGGGQPRSISVEVTALRSDGSPMRFADVDSNGRFSIEGVFAIQYKLVVTAIFVPSPMTSPDGKLLRNKVKTASQVVTVVPGHDAEVTITIDPNQD